jgi:5-methylcytosine-specific restriction endonuclease McrA
MVHGGDQRSRLGYAYTVEHVTPIARGGKTTSDNLRLTHARCNQRRGTCDVRWYPLPCYRPRHVRALQFVLGTLLHSRFREVTL